MTSESSDKIDFPAFSRERDVGAVGRVCLNTVFVELGVEIKLLDGENHLGKMISNTTAAPKWGRRSDHMLFAKNKYICGEIYEL